MNIIFVIVGVAYVLLIGYTVIHILLYTRSTSKALGYLLLVILIPVIGIVIYFAVGLNFRHFSSRYKTYQAQKKFDENMLKQVSPTDDIPVDSKSELGHFSSLEKFLQGVGQERLHESFFTLLTNGEEKFPEVLRVLASAKHSIHMEYYAWENDIRGNEIKNVLLKKAKEGVTVRIMYDDYASRKIKSNLVRELKAGGISVIPRIKVKLAFLANRVNHRDHRKIIIVDGTTGFVGGINVSDRYDNSIDTGLYWRDTHVKIEGPLAGSLQRHFIIAWNSCQSEQLTYTQDFFPNKMINEPTGIKAIGQVVAGGPVYPASNIMLSYLKIFTTAKEKLYITNPYLIPNESILDALKQAAISGVDVRLMIPYNSDSQIVGAAAKFYFPELVRAGVKIYLYRKGFIHAKTVVADSCLSVIGTANLDMRSFDLNFEIMSVIYGQEFAAQFEKTFVNDLKESVEVTNEMISHTNLMSQLFYSIARLMSSFL